jgi:hypothetical protein
VISSGSPGPAPIKNTVIQYSMIRLASMSSMRHLS